MNKIKSIIIGVAAVLAIVITGCASAHKKAETTHEVWDYSIQNRGVTVKNEQGETSVLKPVAVLKRHEVWTDRYKGGGAALLADPKASQIESGHTNQNALGGGSGFAVGEVQSNVSTNGIKAVGEAGGEVLGTIGEKLLKKD